MTAPTRKTRLLALGGLAAAVVSLTAAPASAEPSLSGHDCAGFFTSAGAGPELGPTVAGLAHAQAVDDLPFANCGASKFGKP